MNPFFPLCTFPLHPHSPPVFGQTHPVVDRPKSFINQFRLLQQCFTIDLSRAVQLCIAKTSSFIVVPLPSFVLFPRCSSQKSPLFPDEEEKNCIFTHYPLSIGILIAVVVVVVVVVAVVK
ncbi:hypothetical protein CEXT_700291 [Caerostris extrusa]|uniref:Transmembrane protein n=1 Tax=Caerostris extrusa TaxID=172846 RepID=A0AAV4UKV8_CAEEX|nr:hypothetical protein CEXT_700291 [Caerostris extrusa]